MNYTQILISTDSKSATILSDIFLEFGALSVSIEDADSGTDLEEPIFDEPEPYNNKFRIKNSAEEDKVWQKNILKVLTLADLDINELMNQVETLFGTKLNFTVEELANEDWVRKTQSQFNPIKVTDNLYIVPSWHTSPNPSAINIALDPGLAFGTGTHATTFMCLKWLSNNLKQSASVLDYGCGSGILAIAAEKLGASVVYGTDIDPLAIDASIDNAVKNNSKATFLLPDELPQTEFDIVVANILANPLRILAPLLASKVREVMILSGILQEQAAELSQIYSKWFKVSVIDTMDGWALLECTTHDEK